MERDDALSPTDANAVASAFEALEHPVGTIDPVQVRAWAQEIVAQAPTPPVRGRRTSPRTWITLGFCAWALAMVFLRANETGSHGVLPVRAQVYRTGAGQTGKFQLPDGSVVQLAPASQIRYQLVDGATASIGRAVVLDGEALFTVVHASASPFTVRARGAIVHVLGTTFAVRNYGVESRVRVTVLGGRVGVRSQSRPLVHDVILDANMRGVLNDSGDVNVVHDAHAADDVAWINGSLVFRQLPLRDALAQLSRVYGADLRIGDTTLVRETVTMTIRPSVEALSDVLDVLAPAVGAHYTRAGNVVTLVPGLRASMGAPKGTPRSLTVSPEKTYGK